MATSQTTTWNPQFCYIAQQALYHCGVIAEDEVPDSAQYEKVQFQANAIIKAWEASGLHVWTEEEGILFLQPLQYRYLLGGCTTDHVTWAFGYALSQLAVSAALGANSIQLIEVAGFNVGDNIGVFLDSQFIFWTTVAAVNSVTGLVTLNGLLPSSAGSGNYCADYPHCADLPRPLKVKNPRSYRYNGATEVPMWLDARQQYMDLPNKTTPGTPIEAFYSPKLLEGEFFIWNPINIQNWAVRFTWYRSLQDIICTANTVDFPQEWINPLLWQTAFDMVPGAGTPPDKVALIKERMALYTTASMDYDRESEDILFGVNADGRSWR